MKQLPICWLTSLCPFLTTITTLLTLTETFHCSLTVNTFEPPVSDNLKTQAVSFGRMAAYESLVHMIGHRRLKEKQNLKVVAVVYERWALTIGFQYLCSDLTRKRLVSWRSRRRWLARGGRNQRFSCIQDSGDRYHFCKEKLRLAFIFPILRWLCNPSPLFNNFVRR